MKLISSPLAIATLLLASGLAHAKPPAELIKLEVMTTTRGKTYKKLTVRDITPAGIKIVHEGGAATLHYEELPEYLRKRLGKFDPEEARQYLEEEDKRLKEQQGKMERGLSRVKKDEKPSPTSDEDEKEDVEKSSPDPDEDVKPTFVPYEDKEPAPKTTSYEDDKPVPRTTPYEDVKPAPRTTPYEEDKPAPKPIPAPPERAIPAPPEDPAEAPVGKGTLTARIIGYKTGVKRVEFSAATNCDAKLTVRNIPPYHRSQTFDIKANTPFVREIWVYNEYSSELLALDGKKLDYEDRTKKTETGRLTPAKLR